MGCEKKYLIACLLLVTGCNLWPGRTTLHKQDLHIATVDNNVCKRLYGDVVIYAVFVDSKVSGSWTTFDITSTIDSIQKAADWIMNEARSRDIPLNIVVSTHERAGVIPVRSELPRNGLFGTIGSLNPTGIIDRWSDKAGRQVLAAFPRDTAKVTLTKVQPKDSERLIARLRDIHGTDNIALLYFINNYFNEDISVALHTGSSKHVEYAVVSFKRPAVIIHEFLHLFGALDLYMSPFDKRREQRKRKAFAMQEFPMEIMAFPYRHLDSLTISPVTSYLIGWDKRLDEKYARMLTGKKIPLAKY